MNRLELLPAVLGLLASALAQTPPARPSVLLETADGQSTFRIGERIPVKLTFSNPGVKGFIVAPVVSAGRGTEFDCNWFTATPTFGTTDPLATYFKRERLLTGHGWPWGNFTKPVEAGTDLNQWIRFDRPGNYTVTLTSSCVQPGFGSSDYRLTATIAIHIVPATPEWQAEKLKQIVAVLDREDRAAGEAASDLRYLATPAAIDEMTSRLRKRDWLEEACSMGLVGLPDSLRDIAIASMTKRIEDPDFPVSRQFFSTMSFLHVAPGSEKEDVRQQEEAYRPELLQEIFAAVSKKTSAARAVTVQTLTDEGGYIRDSKIDAQISSLLSTSFLDLDDQSQVNDLYLRWDRLDSPAFLTILKKLATLPSNHTGEPGPYTNESLKTIAIHRWYQLDPAGAHQEILAEVGSQSPAFTAEDLSFLPPEQMPQFEPIWAKAFLATTDQLAERVLGSLLVRFGAGAATPQMIRKLAERPKPYSCDAHVYVLAYLIRFSPDEARPRLEHEVATNEGDCGANLFDWISRQASGPVLNDVAVKELDNPDPSRVLDAVRYLTAFGRKQDREPLLRHYVQWADAHRGKTSPLDTPPPLGAGAEIRPEDAVYEWLLGEELGNALLSNQGFFADAELIALVMKRCVGEEMRGTLQTTANRATPPYDVVVLDPSTLLGPGWAQPGSVAQYAPMSMQLLDEKVGQFPPGSKFILSRIGIGSSDGRLLREEVHAIFARHHFTLEDAPK